MAVPSYEIRESYVFDRWVGETRAVFTVWVTGRSPYTATPHPIRYFGTRTLAEAYVAREQVEDRRLAAAYGGVS